MTDLIRFLKCLFGFSTLDDRCWFSARYWDKHDYFVSHGGDGTPSHFFIYHCHNCGKEFGI